MRNPWLKALAVTLVLAWTGGLAVGGERDMARARGLFAQAQRGIKLEASAAHIKLGIWCRDAGLPPQATAEFLRAVEVSEGQHPLAIKLVDIMRAWGDKFWKYVQKKPQPGPCTRGRGWGRGFDPGVSQGHRRARTHAPRRGGSSAWCKNTLSSPPRRARVASIGPHRPMGIV